MHTVTKYTALLSKMFFFFSRSERSSIVFYGPMHTSNIGKLCCVLIPQIKIEKPVSEVSNLHVYACVKA